MDAHNLHMHMTAMRPQTPEDTARANEIVSQLRSGIEKYKDYHVALNDGYKIFCRSAAARVSLHELLEWVSGVFLSIRRAHFLLYKKTSDGYELVGAMYTMPKRATEEQLNARVPLSVATWHLHTNLCMPQKGQLRNADWKKFGLRGSIGNARSLRRGEWPLSASHLRLDGHVYPYEDSLDKVFVMHHHMD